MEGVDIWYRVDSSDSYAEVLRDFTKTDLAALREAVRTQSLLTDPARTLKPIVTGSNRTEMELEHMRHLEDEEGRFDFKKLVVDYNIKPRNPILVKLQCK